MENLKGRFRPQAATGSRFGHRPCPKLPHRLNTPQRHHRGSGAYLDTQKDTQKHLISRPCNLVSG